MGEVRRELTSGEIRKSCRAAYAIAGSMPARRETLMMYGLVEAGEIEI
jgi:hypothetical protein